MASISDAVSSERVSKIVGYKLDTIDLAVASGNLPQRIAVFGEANEANQATLSTDKTRITTAVQAGELYGFGSSIHMMARIILSANGGVGGIPVFVFAQAEAAGATTKIIDVAPSGTATKGGTHTLVVAGREGLEGVFYNIQIQTGDEPSDITKKISDAVNAVLGSPMIGSFDAYSTNLESKWAGATADDITVTVNTNGLDLGVTYVINSIQTAIGTPSVQAALDQFGSDWITRVVNSYGTDDQTMTTLEAFNGRPDPSNPTGRFLPIVMKPFIAITGSVAEDPSSITDTRLDDVTIAIAPAPKSPGLQFEAAANMCVKDVLIAQNNPHLDVSGSSYNDMPIPSDSDIGAMSVYNNRDAIVKKGSSTVDLVSDKYQIQDYVTTYHKLGEDPPQFRYVRNLANIDMNVRFTYLLKEEINVVDHALAADDDIVAANKVVKPKSWRQVVNTMADELALRALIVDPEFLKDSLQVGISSTNPDRFETSFNYKRSGFARILSTTAKAGFNFGTLT